jgi:hypothetical protein
MAGRFKMGKRLAVTMVLGLAVLGVAIGTAGASTQSAKIYNTNVCKNPDTTGAKVLGAARFEGKNGDVVITGHAALPAGEYKLQLLHDDCTVHSPGGGKFKTSGGDQQFSFKAPDVDDPTMYVQLKQVGGGFVATSGPLKVNGID